MRIVNHTSGLRIDLDQEDMMPSWKLPDSGDLEPGAMEAYRSDFDTRNSDATWFGFESTIQITQIDNMVCRFFNDELARAMTLADWAAERRGEREAFYLIEDAVARHCACWDYLFQVLVHVLRFQEETVPTSIELQQLLGLQAYDIDFVPTSYGATLRHTRRDLATAIRAISRRRERLSYLRVGSRADDFFRRVRRRYASSDWLSELRRLVRSPAVREIRDLRNTSAHSYPLGSSTSVHVGDPIPAAGFSFSQDLPRPGDLMTSLRAAHSALEAAIVLTRRAVIGSAIPNLKENEGTTYRVDRVRCPDCGRRSYLPHISEWGVESPRPCQNCGAWTAQMATIETIEAPEIVYFDIVHQVRESIRTNASKM